MLQTRLNTRAGDRITVVLPKNGRRNWLRVQFGSPASELWIGVSSARQLYEQLGACLAELDAERAKRTAKC